MYGKPCAAFADRVLTRGDKNRAADDGGAVPPLTHHVELDAIQRFQEARKEVATSATMRRMGEHTAGATALMKLWSARATWRPRESRSSPRTCAPNWVRDGKVHTSLRRRPARLSVRPQEETGRQPRPARTSRSTLQGAAPRRRGERHVGGETDETHSMESRFLGRRKEAEILKLRRRRETAH